ncbi:MAG: Tfp pilus assembly protein FimT/FimU [Candidatus Omnitrophota bacterium]
MKHLSFSQSAFSLIEIILVTVIMLVLIGAAVPRFRSVFRRWEVREAAQKFADTLRYARARAAAHGSAVRLLWEDDRSGYRLQWGSAEEDDQSMPGEWSRLITLPEGVAVTKEDEDDQFDLLVFPDGGMAAGKWRFCGGELCFSVSSGELAGRVLVREGAHEQ